MKAGTHVRPSTALIAAQGETFSHGYILGPGLLPNSSFVWWLDGGYEALLRNKWLTPMSDQPRARSLYGCPPDDVLKTHGAGVSQLGAAHQVEKDLQR